MELAEARAGVDARLASWPESLSFLVEDPSEEAAFAEARTALQASLEGGKRTRALLCAAGLACARQASIPQVANAGCALELFQASALVHDDLIDNSPMRRGRPAMHESFVAAHRQASWNGNARSFGSAAAITLGDLLLAGASSEFEQAMALSEPADALGALRLFNQMMLEVAYGQFLDVREENLPLDTEGPVGRALAIVRHKSARYSVELPLALGALLGGGSKQLVDSLRRLGLSLGMAFQLRDDDLGIFGDSAVTGKPACGDIAEGKRTVLLALLRERLEGADLAFVDGCLGRPLSDEEAARIQDLAVSCGARAEHERMIAGFEARAEAAFAELDARDEGRAMIRSIMDKLEGRTA